MTNKREINEERLTPVLFFVFLKIKKHIFRNTKISIDILISK